MNSTNGRIGLDIAFKMRYDVSTFVRVFFPDLKLTRQQQEFIIIWGDLLRAKHLLYEKGSLGEHLEIYRKVFGVSLSAGQGVGKDFISALLLWHFMMCFFPARVLSSATSGSQTKTVFWTECRKLASLARKLPNGKTIIEDFFEIKDEEIRVRNAQDERQKTHRAERKSPRLTKNKDEQGETFAGLHSDYMLYIIDEASKVPEGLFKPIEGSATGKVNVALLAFNPTRRASYAVKTQVDPKERQFWIPIRWNAEECELVSPDHIQRMREKYCEPSHFETVVDSDGVERSVLVTKNHDKSSAYRVRVLGLPPLSDDDALFPRDWIEDAVIRDKFTLQMNIKDQLIGGMDVGGNASPSVIAMRRGLVFHPSLFTFRSNDANQVAEWGVRLFRENNMYQIAVDKNGIGWGVYNMMRDMLGYNVDGSPTVIGIDAQGRSMSPRYGNKRAELAYRLRTAFEKRGNDGSGCPLVLPNDTELVDELSMVSVIVGSSPFMLTKKSVGDSSPNKADAVMLSFFRMEWYNDDEEEREKGPPPPYILNPLHPYYADKVIPFASANSRKNGWQAR